eukprot:2656586-Rhodomonas_salina.1
MGSECSSSSHKGRDCGNKEVSKLKRNNGWPAIHLDVFPGMGLGIRSTNNIAAGMIVGPYYGRAKHMQKRRSRLGHHYLVEMEREMVIDASREGSLMRYVNSSCDPNVRFVEKVIEGRSELFYISTRLIRMGEDITPAYGDGLVAWAPSAATQMSSRRSCRRGGHDKGTASEGGQGGKGKEKKGIDSDLTNVTSEEDIGAT